jgi:hypothetical protein
MANVEECLPSKHEALNSNLVLTKVSSKEVFKTKFIWCYCGFFDSVGGRETEKEGAELGQEDPNYWEGFIT